jgi:hypothetical protein
LHKRTAATATQIDQVDTDDFQVSAKLAYADQLAQAQCSVNTLNRDYLYRKTRALAKSIGRGGLTGDGQEPAHIKESLFAKASRPALCEVGRVVWNGFGDGPCVVDVGKTLQPHLGTGRCSVMPPVHRSEAGKRYTEPGKPSGERGRR